jgi:hypothetical protein
LKKIKIQLKQKNKIRLEAIPSLRGGKDYLPFFKASEKWWLDLSEFFAAEWS